MGFAFNVPSFDESTRSAIRSSGIPLGTSTGSSTSPITYSGYLNGVRVVSNQAPSLLNSLLNSGSHMTGSKSNADDNKLDNMLSTIGKVIGLGQGIYNIFNSERNYQNEKKAYQSNLDYLNRVLSNQENAIVNQAEQYAKIGLNPLYMSGNGMSYSTGGFPDAPKHSNLENLAILNQMDQLKNSEASRALSKSQADLNEAKSVAQGYLNLLNFSKLLLNFENIPKVRKQVEDLVVATAAKTLDNEIKTFDFDYSKNLGVRYKDSLDTWQKVLGMASYGSSSSSTEVNSDSTKARSFIEFLNDPYDLDVDPVTGIDKYGFKHVSGTGAFIRGLREFVSKFKKWFRIK